MRTHRRITGRRGEKVLACLLALLAAFVLPGCSERVTDPVGPAGDPQVGVGKNSVGGQLIEGINFYSVPDPSWPGNPQNPWRGDLVVYAHGYYAPADLQWTPDKDQVDGTPIGAIVNNLGMAYASTSYRAQGLVVPEAVEDIVALVQGFININWGIRPSHIYLVGPSEGGLVTTLAVEKYPGVFNGGMAMCGPIGDFRKQMDYFGDFHLLFNYFFPGVVPGNPQGIPPVSDPIPLTLDDWNYAYKDAVQLAVANSPSLTSQLLRVSRASIDLADPSSIQKTVTDILWYNLFATNDAIIRLDGYPFNNRSPYRWYIRSNNDLRLNLTIPRMTASATALAALGRFQTSGRLRRPLVTLHTTGDPIIPYWHATLYSAKTIFSGSFLRHTHIPIVRYGHCNFKVYEVLAGFAVLVLKVTAGELLVTQKALPNPEEQNRLMELARKHGANPRMSREIAVMK
jgi:pimeloyl-ACP methyl ester carboxylesterase